MKYFLFTFIVLFYVITINSQNTIEKDYENESKLEVISEVFGDLNNDGIDEKVIVYDTNRMTDSGTEREIHIYKKENNNWKLWIKSTKGIRKSEEFGMVGDFGIEINNGILTIYHSDGGRWRRVETHKYKFKEDSFYLIGVTIRYGTLCAYWQSLDYNLVTGNINYEKEFETCNENGEWIKSKFEKENFNIKPNELPNLTKIEIGKNKIITPKLKAEMYY